MIPKTTFITLCVALFCLFISPVKACEPPGPGITWYLLQLTVDPIVLPKGVEINIISTTSQENEENSLSLANNTDGAVYIVADSEKASELRELYEANQDDPDWISLVEAFNSSPQPGTNITKIDSAQTEIIYQGQYWNFGSSITPWPMDYGGHRPDDVALPDSLEKSIMLVHQGGVQTVPFIEAIVLNPAYPDKPIWTGCDEFEVILPTPTLAPIGSENTAVANNPSINPLWFIAGLGLLIIVVWGIYKSRQSRRE